MILDTKEIGDMVAGYKTEKEGQGFVQKKVFT